MRTWWLGNFEEGNEYCPTEEEVEVVAKLIEKGALSVSSTEPPDDGEENIQVYRWHPGTGHQN